MGAAQGYRRFYGFESVGLCCLRDYVNKLSYGIHSLAATTFSSAVQAQSEISKRERILQVLDQSRPNEYVTAAFFLHFPDKLVRKAVADHAEYYEATNMDFVKVYYEIVVPQIDIKKGADSTIPCSTDYDKLRAVIVYAHTWRQTHKK